MNAQDQTTVVQANISASNIEDDRIIQNLRRPWQTPEVTHLEIKRTMNSSGAFNDGVTSHNVPT